MKKKRTNSLNINVNRLLDKETMSKEVAKVEILEDIRKCIMAEGGITYISSFVIHSFLQSSLLSMKK